jgi:hypothetical protein
MFRGSIPKGSTVTAELKVASGANGTALLSIAFADSGGSGSDSRTVASGTAATCTVKTNGGKGLLRVLVDFNSDTDTGQLTVRANGNVRDNQPITGDTPWSYTLS